MSLQFCRVFIFFSFLFRKSQLLHHTVSLLKSFQQSSYLDDWQGTRSHPRSYGTQSASYLLIYMKKGLGEMKARLGTMRHLVGPIILARTISRCRGRAIIFAQHSHAIFANRLKIPRNRGRYDTCVKKEERSIRTETEGVVCKFVRDRQTFEAPTVTRPAACAQIFRNERFFARSILRRDSFRGILDIGG